MRKPSRSVAPGRDRGHKCRCSGTRAKFRLIITVTKIRDPKCGAPHSCSDPSDPSMAHRWPSALPGDLHRGKQRKLHKTSLIWAFKAAGHPFSGGCQVLHFWCKDAGACRLFSACFYSRALVREFSTGANVAHHRRICDSPDYFCSCTDYRTHQGSNSHTFITQRKIFSSFRLGYAISQSTRPN